ncbi:MAG: hypothetical protein ACI4EA_09085 [Candidatus Ornithomonoglobus sp.]
MEDNELGRAYKELFDGIKASDELKARVLAGKRRKYDVRPVIAAISTIAAAVAVFAAVRGYDFSHRDDGVITETAVTETAAPRKGISEPFEQNKEEADEQAEESVQKPDAVTETAEHAKKPAATPDAAKKTTEDYMREALEGMSTAAPSKEREAPESIQPPSAYAPKESAEYEQGTVPSGTNEKVNEEDEEQGVSAAKTRIIERSSVPEASVSDDQGGSLVIPFPTGPVTLRMNSQSVLAELMYEIAPASEDTDTAEEYHTEKWDNQMYFDYLGIDIINDLKLSDDMKYSGDNAYYFAVDTNGRLRNDTRIFTFEGSEGRLVSVLTSRDTTFVDSVLSSPEVMKSRISDIQVAAFQPDQAYYFYMKSNDVAYIITTEELDGQEIADLLFSIDTEQ